MTSNFDPFAQNVTFHLANGEPFNVALQDVDAFAQYPIRICINYGAQLGASLVLLLILLLLTKSEKRRSYVFCLNCLALLLNFARLLCQILFFTSPFVNPYAYFASDYSRVPDSAYANSILAVIFYSLLLTLIEASLVLQVHAVCANLRRIYRNALLGLSVIIALVPIAFRYWYAVENIKSILGTKTTQPVNWIESISQIAISVSICCFCAVFVTKLAFAIRLRRKLGIIDFGPMKVIFIMGCQTMVIPALFSIIHYSTDVPELSSNVLTLVTLSLPLSSIWAGTTLNKANAVSTYGRNFWQILSFSGHKTTRQGSCTSASLSGTKSFTKCYSDSDPLAGKGKSTASTTSEGKYGIAVAHDISVENAFPNLRLDIGLHLKTGDTLDVAIASEITYYNNRITPDLVVTDSSSNPFRWSLKLSAIAPMYLNYAYAAISVFHRIVQRSYIVAGKTYSPSMELTAPGQLSDPEGPTFYHYYAAALKSVNEELSKTTKKLNIIILAGIMMLLFSQLQQAAYGQWRVHLNGFKRIISHYGGMERLLEQYMDTRFLLSNALIIDTMSTTTMPASQMTADTISWHMEYLRILPRIDYDVIPTPTPIPPHMLKVIIMVNLARATARQTRENKTDSQESEFTLSQILVELDIVFAQDSSDLLHDTDPKNTLHENRLSPTLSSTKESSQTIFTTSYRSAITLYAVESYLAMETASLTQILDPTLLPETTHAIKTSSYSSLMYSIRTLFAQKRDTASQPKRRADGDSGAYWKFIFWPLAIAGVHCATEHRNREDYEYICERLYEMTAVLGTLCMRDAAVFIRRLWGEAGEVRLRGGAMSWDEIFRDAPLFLL
ncbi:fungal pheromone mating factor STE2 GPCR-domain-containing protein [Aspergillus heterothallicus]